MLLIGRSSVTATHYFRAFNATQQAWNGTIYDAGAGTYANYVIAASAGAFGWYSATAPALARRYELVRQAGGTAASTDPVVWTDDAITENLTNLDAASSALLSAIQNVQNGTFISANIPAVLERPDSGSQTLTITVIIADETGAPKDIDAAANPGITLVNQAGADLSARLSAWSHPGTGEYTITYTNGSANALDDLLWRITGTVNGKARKLVALTQLVDVTAVDFTSADRTTLNAIAADYFQRTSYVAPDNATLAALRTDYTTTRAAKLDNLVPFPANFGAMYITPAGTLIATPRRNFTNEWYLRPDGNNANDGKTPYTAKLALSSAVAAATSAGGSNRFDLGEGSFNFTAVTFPDNSLIEGMGWASVLTTSSGTVTGNLKVRNAIFRNLRVKWNTTGGSGTTSWIFALDPTFVDPGDPELTPPTTLVLDNVWASGDSDLFQVNVHQKIVVRDSLLETCWDMFFGGDADLLDMARTTCIDSGDSTVDLGPPGRYASLILPSFKKIRLRDCTLDVRGAPDRLYVHAIEGGPGTEIDLHNVGMKSAGTANVFDIFNPAGGIIRGVNVSGSGANGALTVSGTPPTISVVADDVYTSARGARLDNLNAPVADVPAATEVVLAVTHGPGAWDAAGGGSLTGPSQVTLTFRDEGGAPVPLVDFTVVGEGSARADALGVASFGMPDGDFILVARPTNGVIFPTFPLHVDGDTAADVPGATIVIVPPTDPAQLTAYGTTRDGGGTVRPNATMRFTLVQAPPDTSGALLSQRTVTATSDVDGLLQIPLLKSAAYKVRSDTGGEDELIETSDADTFEIPTLIV